MVAVTEKTLKQDYSQEYPKSAMHVQGSDVSRSSAIHNAYHNLQRSSSSSEPRDSLLKFVNSFEGLGTLYCDAIEENE